MMELLEKSQIIVDLYPITKNASVTIRMSDYINYFDITKFPMIKLDNYDQITRGRVTRSQSNGFSMFTHAFELREPKILITDDYDPIIEIKDKELCEKYKTEITAFIPYFTNESKYKYSEPIHNGDELFWQITDEMVNEEEYQEIEFSQMMTYKVIIEDVCVCKFKFNIKSQNRDLFRMYNRRL